MTQNNGHTRFETFSFLPPLSPAQAQAQAESLLKNGWVPLIEFADPSESSHLYWQLWPVVAPRSQSNRVTAQDVNASLLMMQIDACARRHPYAFVRLSGFDTARKVFGTSFLARTPNEAIA
ncbi:MAG: ribulose bisphosphate carboxylase small subunit [Alphaproteobacteria bacterium]